MGYRIKRSILIEVPEFPVASLVHSSDLILAVASVPMAESRSSVEEPRAPRAPVKYREAIIVWILSVNDFELEIDARFLGRSRLSIGPLAEHKFVGSRIECTFELLLFVFETAKFEVLIKFTHDDFYSLVKVMECE